MTPSTFFKMLLLHFEALAVVIGEGHHFASAKHAGWLYLKLRVSLPWS